MTITVAKLHLWSINEIILWLGIVTNEELYYKGWQHKEGWEPLDKHKSKQEESRRNVLMEFPVFLVYLTHPKLSINTIYLMTLLHNSRRIWPLEHQLRVSVVCGIMVVSGLLTDKYQKKISKSFYLSFVNRSQVPTGRNTHPSILFTPYIWLWIGNLSATWP